jgi:hypothetical protein
MSGRWLQERVDQVRTVSGAGSASVEDLVETLKSIAASGSRALSAAVARYPVSCEECRELSTHAFRTPDDLLHAVRLAAEEWTAVCSPA